MLELTKEHFDEVVKGLASKADLQQAVAPLATKEQIEDLARMTSRGFEDILEGLDVRERVQVVELKLQKIGEALHIEL